MTTYKKMHVPNTFFKWKHNHIFPIYSKISGSVVSQKRINRLKKLAIAILREEELRITKTFQTFLQKKYPNKYNRIKINTQLGINKIRNTIVCPASNNMYGESSDTRIWIARDKLSDIHLLGTMLHESLHYMCTVDGQDVNTEDEHEVMQLLGEDCVK